MLQQTRHVLIVVSLEIRVIFLRIPFMQSTDIAVEIKGLSCVVCPLYDDDGYIRTVIGYPLQVRDQVHKMHAGIDRTNTAF